MLHYLTDEARAGIADKRAEIVAAQGLADTFARSDMSVVAARYSALQEGLSHLGDPPTLDGFATAADWRQATDQHTFDSRFYAREAATVEHQLNAKRDEYTALTATVVTLKEQLRKIVLDALDGEAVRRTKEAAELANVRQSLLNRIPRDQWHTVASEPMDGPPTYQVQASGWADVSFFQARVSCGGFGPEKSAGLVAELGFF